MKRSKQHNPNLKFTKWYFFILLNDYTYIVNFYQPPSDEDEGYLQYSQWFIVVLNKSELLVLSQSIIKDISFNHFDYFVQKKFSGKTFYSF